MNLNKKDYLIAGVISIVLIIGGLFLFNNDNNITGFAIADPIKTCKTVSVPYEVQEEYQVPLKYEVLERTKTNTLKGFDLWTIGIVRLRNVDSETGMFTVEQTFKTLDSEKTLKSSNYVMPGEVKEFRNEFDIDLGEDVTISYKVIPDKKTLTRTVTKYRQEERCD